jgi:hypothetical protein
MNILDLRELDLSGRQYTWANNLQSSTLEKLDRILVSMEWELKYPMVTVNALPRTISDHTPLLLNMAMSSQHTPHLFKFELGWLLKDGFYDMVTWIWQKERKGSTPLEMWQNKIRTLRRYLKGGQKTKMGLTRKKKRSLK